ncbi:S-layer homology domain-containing protein [Paenibacillus sp. PL91]|uniref:S-layer homology domain-containing protein n=1 Tax=Paenibacillus sp. PL91 TaxID=2729538 RepID=UPI0016597CD0|nr:S-layer homology domain-containing protein [Paenibacillus sp. PL91]MBC9203669.1 S-layer homology domain-containing protein [Paenibacillus sp. PL91]
MFKQKGIKKVFSSVLSFALLLSLISVFPASTEAADHSAAAGGSFNLLDPSLFTPMADVNLKVSSEDPNHPGADALRTGGSGYWRNASSNVYMNDYSPSSLALTLDLGASKTVDKLYLEIPNSIPNIQSNATRFEVYYSNSIHSWESAPTVTNSAYNYDWKANGWTLAGGTETEGLWSYVTYNGQQWGFDTKTFLYPFTARYVMINTVLVGPRDSRTDDNASLMGISGLTIYGKDPIMNTTVLEPAKDTYSTWDQTAPIATTINLADGQTLANITKGGHTLQAGTDYSISGNTVTFALPFLAKLPLGTNEFMFHFNSGDPSLFAMDVTARGHGENNKTIKMNAIEGVSPYNILGGAMGTDEPVEGVTKRIRDGYHDFYGDQPAATAADDHIKSVWDSTLNKNVFKVIAHGRGLNNEFEEKVRDGEYAHKGVFDREKGYVVGGASITDRQRIEIRPSEDSTGDFVAYEGDLVSYEWLWNIPDGIQWNQPNFRHLFQLKAVNAHEKDTLPGGNTGGENGAYILAISVSGTTSRTLVVNHNRYDGDKTMLRIPLKEIDGHWIKVELDALVSDSGWFTVKITDMVTGKIYTFDNPDVFQPFADKGATDGSKDLWRRPERTGGFETEYPAAFDQYLRPKWGIYRSSANGTNSAYDAELQLSDITISKEATGLSSVNLALNKKAYNVGPTAGAGVVQQQSVTANVYGNANKLTSGVLQDPKVWPVTNVTSLDQIGNYSWLGTDGERKGSFVIDLGQAMDFSQIRLFAKSTRLKGATVYVSDDLGNHSTAAEFDAMHFTQVDKKTAEGYTFATGNNDGGTDSEDSSYPINLGKSYQSRYIKVTVENASGGNADTDLTGPPRLTQVQVFNAPTPPQNLKLDVSGSVKTVEWDANASSEGYAVYNGEAVLADLAAGETSFILPADVTDLSKLAVRSKGTDRYSRKFMISAPTLLEPVFAESLSLNKSSLTINKGSSEQLEATVLPSNAANKTVIWHSSDDTVAAVDQTGLVAGVKEGAATITATIEDTSIKAEAAITVTKSNGSTGPGTNPGSSTPPPSEPVVNTGIIDVEKDAKVTKETSADGATVTKVAVDANKLEKALASPIVVIEVKGSDSIVHVELPGDAIQNAISKQGNAVIQIKANGASYELPISLFKEMPKGSTVSVMISKVTGKAGDDINAAAKSLNAKPLILNPIEFVVTVNGKEWSDFGGVYVNRSISLGALTVDSSKATAVWVDSNNDMHFVPSTLTTKDGSSEITIRSPHNSIYTVIQSDKSFADLQGHWAKADVELLANKWILNGKTDQQFAPDAQITRAEFAAMLVRSLGLVEGKADGFNDVQPSDWFAGAVSTAFKAGLINGYEDGTFRPNANITREQMVAMMIRAIKAGGKEIQADQALLNRFADLSDIAQWSREAVSQALKAGLIQGMSDKTFAPGEPATRAQAAVTLKRMLQSLQFIN